MKKLTPEQQRYKNSEHADWLEHPITKLMLERLAVGQARSYGMFTKVEDVEVFKANALVEQGLAIARTTLIMPPYCPPIEVSR